MPLDHLPAYDKIYTVDTPGLDDVARQPLTVIAPCTCGDGHEWVVSIPPSAWRTVFHLGQLEATGVEPPRASVA